MYQQCVSKPKVASAFISNVKSYPNLCNRVSQKKMGLFLFCFFFKRIVIFSFPASHKKNPSWKIGLLIEDFVSSGHFLAKSLSFFLFSKFCVHSSSCDCAKKFPSKSYTFLTYFPSQNTNMFVKKFSDAILTNLIRKFRPRYYYSQAKLQI